MAVLLIAVGVALALGGPIAGALAGLFFGAAFVANSVLLLVPLLATSIGSRGNLLLMGVGSYVVSLLLVVLLWSLSGQSQIM